MSLTFEQLNEINKIVRDDESGGYVDGANLLLKFLKSPLKLKLNQESEAVELIKKAFFQYIDAGDYLMAATLNFGFDYFDARPPQVQDIFRVCRDHDAVSVFGASSCSKTYSIGIFLICDLLYDPEYTNIIVASVGESHLKGNLFSGLINAVENGIINVGLECRISSMEITLKGSTKKDVGIFGKTFPQDDTKSTGRLRGIKPVKRIGKPHPKFGKMGRVRVLLDEASSIPEGVYMDFGSAMASNNGEGRVKFFVSFNPTIIEHWTTEISKPVGGIEVIDEDNDVEWESERGWHVYRLDGMRSPNVIARKNVCEGMMSYDAMKRKIASGEGSMDYMVYGRGMWMRRGHFSNVIPMDFLTRNRGELVFPEGSENVASVDIAFSVDKTIFTLGRWGLANGYVKIDGSKEMFLDKGQVIEKWCLQIDQQFEIDIPTSDSIKLGNEVMKLAKDLKVKPEWVVLDKTGIGKGVFDLLNTHYGPVFGINWQNKAGDVKIFAEDQQTPHDQYANIGTEMWFTLRSWLEYGIVKIGMAVPANPLFTELTTRRYKPKAARVIVESKLDYKGRASGNNSPDRADSLVQLPLLCRYKGDVIPSMTGKNETNSGFGAFAEQNLEVYEGFEQVESLTLSGNNHSDEFPAITGRWDYGQ